MTQHPSWFTARLPEPEECSLGLLVQKRALEAPDSTFLVLEDGTSWTNQAGFEKFKNAAAILSALALQKGDRFVILLPNGPDLVRYLFGAWLLGVVPVPVNPSLRGRVLQNALQIARASVIVTVPELVPILLELDLREGSQVIAVSGELPAKFEADVRLKSESAISVAPEEPDPVINEPWDTCAIIFSSGTTGIPKGVVTTFAQLWTLGTAYYGYLTRGDRMLLQLPLYHILTLGSLFGAVTAGSSLAVIETFRASKFLQTIRKLQATALPGLGRTFIDVINKTPERPDDAENPLRFLVVQSATPAVQKFRERFGCDVLACYSMSETSCITISDMNPGKMGSMGRPRPGIEVRIVDQFDREVPVSESGEVVLRSDVPWAISPGYFENAEATCRAWRNGWFHTGDIARRDADGDVFFVDRSVDVIRRRGENISSVQIEGEVRAHSDVEDVAALGVETPCGEEILIVVKPLENRALDPQSLFEFLVPRLPHFMLPYFIQIVQELPKTSIGKVQKKILRERGVSKDTWDRGRAGSA